MNKTLFIRVVRAFLCSLLLVPVQSALGQSACTGLTDVEDFTVPKKTAGAYAVTFQFIGECGGQITVTQRGMPPDLSKLEINHDRKQWYIAVGGEFTPGKYQVEFVVKRDDVLVATLKRTVKIE